MKDHLKNLPLLRPLARHLGEWRRHRVEQAELAALRRSPYPLGAQISESIERLQSPLPAEEQRWIAAIEAERQRLEACTDPLDDGSLGAAGLRSVTRASRPF